MKSVKFSKVSSNDLNETSLKYSYKGFTEYVQHSQISFGLLSNIQTFFKRGERLSAVVLKLGGTPPKDGG